MNTRRGKVDTPVNLRALELIKGAHDASGLTQDEVADRSGVPRSTIANIVSPTGAPRLVSADALIRLAIAYGIDPHAWLLELEALARTLLPNAPARVKIATRRPRGRGD